MSDLIGTDWWCPRCQRMREVIDSDTDVQLSGTMTTTTEIEWTWVRLSCDHTDEWRTGGSKTWSDI